MVIMLRCLARAASLIWVTTFACTDPVVKTISVERISPSVDSECGAPADARTMVVRALGEFGAGEDTAQSVELGMSAEFSIDRFPAGTRMLELEVRGFGGALRAVGRSLEFSLEDLHDGDVVPIFMAPRQGMCATGPARIARNSPMLARSGNFVLMAGGTDSAASPVLPLERYDPATATFEQLPGELYADTSPLGLIGATMTELSGGDVVIVGGAATAYQVYRSASETLQSPSFYREARAFHAALALEDNRIFLAGGCNQPAFGGCGNGSELLTSSILDPATGVIEAGPSLRRERIGGAAWLEDSQSILLVGGVDLLGNPVPAAERVFLDGRESELLDQLMGPSAQAPSGAIWAGLAGEGQTASASVSVLSPKSTGINASVGAAFADSDAHLVALEDGSFLALGRAGAQRLRSFDGGSGDLQLEALQGRRGQAVIALPDGTVLIVGGGEGEPRRDAFVYRPSLTGPLTASAQISFFSDALSEGLSARDPSRIAIRNDSGAHAELSLAGSAEEWLIVSGPRFRRLTLETGLATDAGSALLFFAWQSPQSHWKVLLSGGTTPRLVKLVAGEESTIADCSASALGSLSYAENQNRTHEVQLVVQDDRVIVLVAGESVLNCDLDEAPPRGEVGLGLRGSFGDELRVALISLGR